MLDHVVHFWLTIDRQGSRFRENGWEDTQVQFMFDLFVDKELKKSLGQGSPASTEISQKETYLFETKNKLQNLYDMGIRALKEMRVGKGIPALSHS